MCYIKEVIIDAGYQSSAHFKQMVQGLESAMHWVAPSWIRNLAVRRRMSCSASQTARVIACVSGIRLSRDSQVTAKVASCLNLFVSNNDKLGAWFRITRESIAGLGVLCDLAIWWPPFTLHETKLNIQFSNRKSPLCLAWHLPNWLIITSFLPCEDIIYYPGTTHSCWRVIQQIARHDASFSRSRRRY